MIKGEMSRHFCLHHKKGLTKTQIATALFFKPHFFTSKLFHNLGASHNKLVVQNDSAHNNQLVGDVSVLFAFL